MRMFFAKLSYGCLIAALAFNLYFPAARFMSGDPYPGLFGLRQAVVLSNSMTPALQTGDLIIIREAASYSSGDILTYRDRQALVTHRLVEAGDKGLVLQGDANRTPDGLVQQEQILGRLVLRIPGVGQLSLWLREMGRMIGRTIALARP